MKSAFHTCTQTTITLLLVFQFKHYEQVQKCSQKRVT